MMRWIENVACTVKVKNVCNIESGLFGGRNHFKVEEMEWIYLAQDRVQCRAFVDPVMDV
jgi:hypothetical protein